jgi:molybdate transport system regulatory protein
MIAAILTMSEKKIQKTKKKILSPGCRGHIWIDGTEGTFIGYGRVALLEKISEFGSITRAAKSLNISYRHAWELIDSMNRQARKPFIETLTGGKGGGGTRLTAEGEKAIVVFRKFNADFRQFLQKEEKKLFLLLNKQTIKG